jgi:hypothetical protein
MRRIALILGLMLLVSVGCKHVAGKCDCQSHPGDAAPQMITNPHPAAPVPTTLPPRQ